jgi:hypothetical protein
VKIAYYLPLSFYLSPHDTQIISSDISQKAVNAYPQLTLSKIVLFAKIRIVDGKND